MSAKKWYNKIQFPNDSDFIIRITNASFGPSKTSGKPMITCEWETVGPTEKEVNGQMYEMIGITSNPMNHLYYPTLESDSTVENVKPNERLVGKGETVGFLRMAFPENPEYADTFNPENPDQEMLNKLEGMCFLAQMSGDTVQQRKNPTAAQIEAAKAAGKRAEGDVMTHPVTGKPLITYLPKVREIYGLAPAGAGKNTPY